MKTLIPIFALFAAVGVPELAEAQVRWYRGGVVRPYVYGGYPGYYGGYSPVEGYQRGMADVIRARGQAAENASKARINNEEARKKYLENKQKATEVYWERKRKGEAELAKDYAEDRAKREKYLDATRGRKPETLPPGQFDEHTGDLEWPDALQDDIYKEYREKIEAEMALQAETGTTSNAGEVRTLAREMQSLLKDHIRDMSPNTYIASRKFLDRLVNQMALAQSS